MVLCQVCTEFTGLRDIQGVRERVRAFRCESGCVSYISKFTVSCLALYKEANLMGGGETFVCMCACVCIRFRVRFFFSSFLIDLMTKVLFMKNVYGQIVLIKCNISNQM